MGPSPGSDALAKGSRISNRAPPSSLRPCRISPPCSSTIFLHSASPMPVPFDFVVKKGLNRLWTALSGIPGPLSSTEKRAPGHECGRPAYTRGELLSALVGDAKRPEDATRMGAGAAMKHGPPTMPHGTAVPATSVLPAGQAFARVKEPRSEGGRKKGDSRQPLELAGHLDGDIEAQHQAPHQRGDAYGFGHGGHRSVRPRPAPR